MTTLNSSSPIIRPVLRECHERLLENLCCDKVVNALFSDGYLTTEAKKTIFSQRTKTGQIRELLNILEDSRSDDALESLIRHLREEGTQPYLWTLLEYSRVKHKRIRSSLLVVSETHHM